LFLTAVSASTVLAQSKEELSKKIDDLNRGLDKAVVNRDIATLQKGYADDFVFTHGTGLVDSKESWINNIRKLTDTDRFTAREHDSTAVELHSDVAIATGSLSVTRDNNGKVNRYGIRYVRVYALRKKEWQLICHRTTKEWHWK
jgi:ketosteroid isomerase-like protein